MASFTPPRRFFRKRAALAFFSLFASFAEGAHSQPLVFSPCDPKFPLSVNFDASSSDGLSARMDLEAGDSKISLKILSEPDSAPILRFGFTSPLAVAGPARQTGVLRMLVDPCADAYIFGGDSPQPVVLDLSMERYGFSLGDTAGIWALDADAPRMGIWAGSLRDAGLLLGGAAACSLLPADADFDAWFSDAPALPRRLLAASMVWAGYSFPGCRFLLAAALSEEDRGGRGWSARGEGELERKGFRWSLRFSLASAEWKGLGGDAADPWEARSDLSWLLASRLRLEGRVRAAFDGDGEADWETLARATWNGKVWRWKASLGGADSEDAPYIELRPEAYVEREKGGLRLFVRSGCVAEGAYLIRTEISSGFVLGGTKSARFFLEGSYRWEAEGDSWKARARLEVPSEAGSYTISFGTEDWTARTGEATQWELGVALRARVR